MVESRLLRIAEEDGELKAHVGWMCLPDAEDTLESLQGVYGDVLTILQKLLNRKSMPSQLSTRSRCQMRLGKTGM